MSLSLGAEIIDSQYSQEPISAPPILHVDVLGTDDGTGAGKKARPTMAGAGSGGREKRRKVNHACVYCRRSHMTCDDSRPCRRCVKRDIGHLCHDERRPTSGKPGEESGVGQGVSPSNTSQTPPAMPGETPRTLQQNYGLGTEASTIMPWNSNTGAMNNYGFPAETSATNNEFSFLTEFLENLDDMSFFGAPNANQSQEPMGYSGMQMQQQDTGFQSQPSQLSAESNIPASTAPAPAPQPTQPLQDGAPNANANTIVSSDKPRQILLSATKKERFLLIAADQGAGSPNERLNRVIQAKYEAGLLKPYNYVKGYARLSKWMDRNVSQDSKQQILQPLSILRPKFRAVAQTLRDMDLVFIEEAFERLLLDYDRVFSAMPVAACLWRRTGEIYKGNRQFAELVGVDDYMLRDGRLCIYEIMAEESAVNYWEKYGQIAFDSSQKAVLTSCVLRYNPSISSSSSGYATPLSHRKSSANTKTESQEEGFVSCCFSFTIRRDMVGIPCMIVGNFVKC